MYVIDNSVHYVIDVYTKSFTVTTSMVKRELENWGKLSQWINRETNRKKKTQINKPQVGPFLRDCLLLRGLPTMTIIRLLEDPNNVVTILTDTSPWTEDSEKDSQERDNFRRRVELRLLFGSVCVSLDWKSECQT